MRPWDCHPFWHLILWLCYMLRQYENPSRENCRETRGVFAWPPRLPSRAAAQVDDGSATPAAAAGVSFLENQSQIMEHPAWGVPYPGIGYPRRPPIIQVPKFFQTDSGLPPTRSCRDHHPFLPLGRVAEASESEARPKCVISAQDPNNKCATAFDSGRERGGELRFSTTCRFFCLGWCRPRSPLVYVCVGF